ncbi:MAG: ABC transporter permease [Christensenellales bacterium]|jgi:ribose/xylose/arabinose/galactoside ABC-type transport system permease subunit
MKKTLNREAILRSKLFWAVVAEVLILLVGFIMRPDFLSIQIRTLADGTRVLFGTPVDIFNRAAEITIIAMGMTLVVALGGTDISVGALVAVSGAIALKFLRWDVLEYTTPGDYTVKPFIYVVVVPLVACTLMGLFNGSLIAKLKIQPIIATLILMVGGRGIAQIITNGKQFTTQYSPFKFIGNGSVLGIPFPIIITLVVVIGVVLFVRRTSFGMFVESVGINPSASRVSGLRSDVIIIIVYVLTGFLAGIAGLIYSGRITSCDSNNAGQGYEMDAILAVVIGGTSMTGGKFSLIGTVVGSIIIRTITTLVLYFGVVSEAIMAFKAMIIAVVIILQSEPVRKAMAKRRGRKQLNLGGELHA